MFNHVDVGTEGHPKVHNSKTIPGKASAWLDHRHNFEPWTLQYKETHFPDVLRAAGFTVDTDGNENRWGMYPPLTGFKQA